MSVTPNSATGEYVSAGLIYLRGLAKEFVRDLTTLTADIENAIEDSHSNVASKAITACDDLDMILEAVESTLLDRAECYHTLREVCFTHLLNEGEDKEIAPAKSHKGNDKEQ